MNEKLTSRVGRLLSGSVNAMVDAVENMAPEMVMEESIREVDRAIDDVRAELGRTLSARHMAGKRLAEENRKHDDLSEKIRVALAENRDELAKTAVARLMDVEAQIPVLEQSLQKFAEEEAELERYIAALKGRKGEMQSELRDYRESLKSVAEDSPDGGVGPRDSVRSVEKAREAFDRVMENATGLPGGGSFENRKDATQMAELEELARKNRIEERLAEFKASAGQ